jgi:hypothetical protein
MFLVTMGISKDDLNVLLAELLHKKASQKK